jgi:hypothetical protein
MTKKSEMRRSRCGLGNKGWMAFWKQKKEEKKGLGSNSMDGKEERELL